MLWERTVNFDAGNAAGTFEPGQEPKEILRGCLRNPAGEAPLNGLTVFTCNSHTNLEFRSRPQPFVFDEPAPEPADKLPFVRLNKKEKP